MTSKNVTNQSNSDKKRGFASMAKEEKVAIAKKGGQTTAAKAGHKGMAKRGKQGGKASGASRRKK